MTADSLGDRMKEYEKVSQNYLIRRTPVIIRLDGRAFHTFTKCLKHIDATLINTPFSIVMQHLMTSTLKALMGGIQNAVFAYTQSDEMSILLRDWDKHETEQWFNGNIQKIVSISAGIASSAFNDHLRIFMNDFKLIQFDSRVFNLPEAEVVNYFLWRQNDASRNSVQMLARHYFSHKELHEKNNSQIQDMLMLQKDVNWNDIPTWMKRGFCLTKDGPDFEIPFFSQDREYISKHLQAEENV